MTKVTRVLMCPPTHFDVSYVINPHMVPHSVDKAVAQSQWQGLVAALKSLYVKVEVIEQHPDAPDMVFATDQGIVHGDKVLLANFRYPERQPETAHYREWFKGRGYQAHELTHPFPFEGGDALFIGDMLLLGTGFRASAGACEEMSEVLGVDVVPLRLKDPNFYHLDMCFLPLDAETAFYYPGAFSDTSRRLLHKLLPNLHVLTIEESTGFAANSFVTGKTVVTQSGNPTFKRKLERLGRRVVEVDLSEFKKAGGGVHCLINTLERA